MKRPKWLGVLCCGGASLALVLILLSEYSMCQTAKNLLRTTSDYELITDRALMRSASLRRAIAGAQTELAAFRALPLAPASDEESIKAAVEQCALSCGVSCLVSVALSEAGSVNVEAAFRASPAKSAAVLRALLGRRELFVPQRLEWRTLEPGTVSVEAKFVAFFEPGETPKEESLRE